ncbi:MAG: hypothetical protein Q9222_004017, partial [Ikaeria aurantiellina]
LSELGYESDSIAATISPPIKPFRPRRRKKPFPLLLLPTELGFKVYQYALTYDYILVRNPKRRGAASLLRVNRQIQSETALLFYELNAFQIYIGHLPYDTQAAMANVHYMRQCCLHLDIDPQAKVSKLLKHIAFFVKGIWSGNMECLLVDVWETNDWYSKASMYLEKLSWVRQLHLAQVVVQEVTDRGEVKQYQDDHCQLLERSLMSTNPSVDANGLRTRNKYSRTPRLGIQLVGDELQEAKEKGGWVVGNDDLYALFGKQPYTSATDL